MGASDEGKPKDLNRDADGDKYKLRGWRREQQHGAQHDRPPRYQQKESRQSQTGHLHLRVQVCASVTGPHQQPKVLLNFVDATK